jgi:NCAIR mutase (PurE)-related protein
VPLRKPIRKGDLVDRKQIGEILKSVKNGKLSVEDAMERLKTFPFHDMGFTKIDTHRHLRKGFPEVILAQHKTPGQVIKILTQIKSEGNNVLVTRVDRQKAGQVLKVHPDLIHHQVSRTLYLKCREVEEAGKGLILVITAGTSDIPVAEEAAVTAEVMGNQVERIYDVGVAGLHRLLAFHHKVIEARVLVVVAGMEGALPSVVSGLVDKPVIAVPTSVGYGASFGGLSALLGMLNTCASGITVVNIDNGFGAGYAASLINRL